MTAPNYLYTIAIALMVIGWNTLADAETSGVDGSSSSTTLAPDGTPVVHKSLHKKKSLSASSTSSSAPTSVASSPAAGSASATAVTAPKTPDSVLTVTAKAGTPGLPNSLGPTVETGLPVARHSDLAGLGSTSLSDSAPSAPSGLQNSSTYRSTSVTGLPTPGSTSSSSYTVATRTTTDDFPFVSFNRRVKNIYPWKTGIITTMFYIGEGGSSISSTDNMASSWDQNWVHSNRGKDSPYDRNGFASAGHASTVNPFYVALPFNDLVYPDKARRWLPAGWHRPDKDGKPVSACKDRWVEIKTEDGSGHVCFAQWEDVGPLRYDHAEYVFGPERPDTYTRAGLDVSPAVADYLGLNKDKKSTTRWRFVDDEDVLPGQWLKLDEQALLYQAMQHMNSTAPSSLPIQRASQPIDDPQDDSNNKKVGAAKG